MDFVYIKIPLLRHTLELQRFIEQGLDDRLRSNRAGEILSSGTSIHNIGADGSRIHDYHRIDLQLASLQQGLAMLRSALEQLHAPAGTELHYTTRERVALHDLLTASGWVAGQAAAGAPGPGRINRGAT
jgi:hypothetical protein